MTTTSTEKQPGPIQQFVHLYFAEVSKMDGIQQLGSGLTAGLAIVVVGAIVYMAEHGLLRVMSTVQFVLLVGVLAASIIACVKYRCFSKFIPKAAGSLVILGLDFWFINSHVVVRAASDAAPGTLAAQAASLLSVVPNILSWGLIALIPMLALVYCADSPSTASPIIRS